MEAFLYVTIKNNSNKEKINEKKQNCSKAKYNICLSVFGFNKE